MTQLFGHQLYEQIRNAWERDQNHPHRQRPKGPIPSQDTLATFIDVAFRTSIQREEGRPLTFSIMHVEPKVEREKTWFVFPEPLEFSERTLRKLAGALNASTSALLVAKLNSEWVVWGFGYFGSAIYKLGQLPVGTGYEVMWPDALRIHVTSPGSLIVGRGHNTIGFFEMGRWAPAIPTPLTTRAMGDRLIDALGLSGKPQAELASTWQYFSDFLERVLLRMAEAGHGGTLVLVPKQHRAEITGKFHSGYTPQGSFLIAEITAKRMPMRVRGPEQALYATALHERLLSRLDWIADLARIDGALIVDSDFEVISFGAKLENPPWDGPVIIGHDGFNANGEPFDLKRHGTRHASAAALVGACTNVFAFVASSDGPLRGFAHDVQAKQLLCWPDFRASMWSP